MKNSGKGENMFSENQKISGRQVFRLLTYEFLGIGTLLIPTVLAECAGRDGVFSIVTGLSLSLIYLKILRVLMVDMKESYPEYLKKCCRTWGGYLLWFCYFLYFIGMAAYTAYLFATLVTGQLVENVNFYLVLFLILLLAFYGMAGGIEGRARVYEMLFWFLLIPLFVMLIAACRDLKISYWSPFFTSEISDVLTGSYYVLFCYSVLTLILFMKEYVATGKNAEKEHTEGETCRKVSDCACRAVLFSGAILIALYLILLGLFGADALTQMQFPAVTMMSLVQVTGGFLKRTDALMFGVWFFTLYALLNSMIFYGGGLISRVIDDCGGHLEEKKRLIPYFIVTVLVYAAATALYSNPKLLNSAADILWKAGTLFVIGLPVLLCLFKYIKSGKKKRIATTAMILLTGCLILQGCSIAELEDREFPVLLNIEDRDNFERLWQNHAYAGNKQVDYNHLKVVLIEKSFLEDEAAVDEMLSMLKKEKELPWNAYVMTTNDCKKLAQTEENLDTVLGNYLEELLENTSGVRQNIYPTLGMLYNERANHLETLFIPYVDVVDEKPAVTAYEVWRRGCAAGLVDTDTARASFFTQGATDSYVLQLAPEVYVRITDAFCRLKEEDIIGNGGLTEQCVTIRVTGEGEILSRCEAGLRQTVTSEESAKLNERLREYLDAVAEKALAKEIDITNSYRNLGVCNRTRYFEYHNTPAFYERDIKIRYFVNITWKTE